MDRVEQLAEQAYYAFMAEVNKENTNPISWPDLPPLASGAWKSVVKMIMAEADKTNTDTIPYEPYISKSINWDIVLSEYPMLKAEADKYNIVIGYSGMEHVVEDAIHIIREAEHKLNNEKQIGVAAVEEIKELENKEQALQHRLEDTMRIANDAVLLAGERAEEVKWLKERLDLLVVENAELRKKLHEVVEDTKRREELRQPLCDEEKVARLDRVYENALNVADSALELLSKLIDRMERNGE